MKKLNVLFVSHFKSQCGVFEFGKNIFQTISESNEYNFIWLECDSLLRLKNAIDENNPSIIIYNYHPATMPWLYSRVGPKLFKNNINNIKAIQIGIMHEITQEIADNTTSYKNKYLLMGREKLINVLFDYYIAADPTLLLRNPFVFKTGRLLPTYSNNFPKPELLTIGSFGFGTPNKGFEKIVTLVQNEFDDAIIRLNIPAADYADSEGHNANQIASNCKELVKKKGIQLKITHDFLDDKGILDFLGQNSINVFLYENSSIRGLSSALDYAIAVNRPLAISNSSMFRHISNVTPSLCIENNSLKNILSNGVGSLEKFNSEWNSKNILWEYERILDAIVRKFQNPVKNKMGIIRTFQSYWRRALSIPDKSFTWLRNTSAATEDHLSVDNSINYQPVILSNSDSLNRILDNSARSLYQPAVEKIFEIVPKTMSKKIPEANVQQAFVFDTVCRYLPQYVSPKILCVGSYEDTASMSLIRMGARVEEIDPMINYFLQEYMSKPTTELNSYDIIFSTSVIEHDPDDESFVKCINDLLTPGGIAIITCDYKEDWKTGDPKPAVDERFYSKHDLQVRLISHMKDCTLVDLPQWDCPNPDFYYLGKYNYTFATFVVKKHL
jgi:SAM-dependent methyltransferase